MSCNVYGSKKATRRKCKRSSCLNQGHLLFFPLVLLCLQYILDAHTSNNDMNVFDYLHECSLLTGTIYFGSGFNWNHQLLSLRLSVCVTPEICSEVTAGAGHSRLFRKGNFQGRKHIPPVLHDLHCLPGLGSPLSQIWSIKP